MNLLKYFSFLSILILVLSCKNAPLFEEKIEVSELTNSNLLVKYVLIDECDNSDKRVIYEVDQDGTFSYKPIKHTIPIPVKAWLREGSRKLSSDDINQIKELLNTNELEKLSKEITLLERGRRFTICTYISSLTIRDGIKEKTFKLETINKKYPEKYTEIIGKVTSKLSELKNINLGNHKYSYSFPLTLTSNNKESKMYSSYDLEKDGSFKYSLSNDVSSNISTKNVKLNKNELEEFLSFIDKVNISEKGETLTLNSTSEALELQKKSLTHKSLGLRVNNISAQYPLGDPNIKENVNYEKAFTSIEGELIHLIELKKNEK
jgi:hypothetical protein